MARVSRILITPPGNTCFQPAQIEIKEAVISQSTSALLERRNPCSIPTSKLHKEQKRCRHCLTFSGADITMQVRCSGVARNLRMDILDRDIYDPAHAKTPEQTSWTMRLLDRLDTALGPGAMQKPIFATADPTSPPSRESVLLRELAAGRFNDLFPRTTWVLSDLYRQAMQPPPQPSVYVISREPPPVASEAPVYPPLARVANISGRVKFTATLGADGHPTEIQAEGHPLLKQSVRDAVSGWVYANTPPGRSVGGVIEFRNNCTIP